MQRRRVLAGPLLLAWASVARSEVMSGATLSSDRRVLPAQRREFSSPSGLFEFVVSSPDAWKSRRAAGELSSIDSRGQRRSVWREDLPESYGPRSALVFDDGRVLLIDDWINSPSEHALLLLNPSGEAVTDLSFDALAQLLSVSRRVIATHAKHGTWLSAEPRYDATSGEVSLPTAGLELRLRLSTGEVRVERLPSR